MKNFLDLGKYAKKLSLGHKLKLYNPYIFAIGWCKPLIRQTEIF